MQDPPAESPGSLDERWNREILHRAWWITAAERDDQATEHDLSAEARDATAERRDRSAEQRDQKAIEREEVAFDRAVAAVKALALADRRSAQLWAEALARVESARVAHERNGDEQSAAALQRADDEGEAVIVALVQAAIERDEARAQLRHIAQYLAAAEQDRRESAGDRAAAAAERQAARRDRDAARSARQQAAIDRAIDEPDTS